MGCGTSKVLPEASMKGYVSVVQSLVAFSKAQGDDGEPKKRAERQRGPWFKTPQPASNTQRQAHGDGRRQDKVAKYKDKFDPRVTAR